ncbi:MAG TPA: bifunctional molybdenum cofactor biosynthesis protein MoaC/MoaB [Leptospiraceae bacterium]|nr:bifunctional molybdenum cofactor biosynthesis protein MoaC/MoaB [Leptospiraceae bacterium]HMW05238.1 bifunctional molybdenum cofactor biosynthesis protein MoaC/MoaB [Leptospiraceae bacterium]HMX31297.1 bifunctional molybdenum cofactor biosynthesis protein MoaC/MoaB [Leptospiraceae bacterium]HMY32103.1 bifunctional molybdenum cofactor biosynthesis protein MoaC/MoaB [Leptospiraceae bacterium]HMZ64680.1 bifunctional molybdenum cofactor biosynthesis protein MoaC/MoaB [Leptospiraceae bacterium]
MKDITSKQISLRTASAEGFVLCSPETIHIIRNNALPKGDLFNIAKAAAMLAAKNTSNLIPHCHPVAIEAMDIEFDTLENVGKDEFAAVKISISAKSIGRTGIEMEVLTAVSIAALTIYDLLKPVDKNILISDIRLTEKKGGKTDKKNKVKPGIKAAILVCSDSTAEGKREDKSGKIIHEMLSHYKVEIADYKIIPDEPTSIQKYVLEWVQSGVDFIFTTGGTGIDPRDKTIDALVEIFDREIDGISETMRAYGQARTPFAMLSRSIAGVIGKSIVIAVPGSSNGARESLEAILPGVFHGRDMLLGGGHPG